MGNIEIFENQEFGRLQIIMNGDEPWFIGNEVAKLLGYENVRNAVPRHVDDEDKMRTRIEYAGQNREVTIINESGLYSLITNFRTTAKELGIKQNQFINWLLENNFVYRDNHNKLMLYAQHEEYFCVKDSKSASNKWAGTQTLITPKGKEAFRLLLGVSKND